MRKIQSKRILHHNIKKATAQFIKTHQKKFKNLTCNTSLPFTSNETVTNISSHSLTSEQLFISSFSFGLFLCFFIRKLRKNKNIVILKPDKGSELLYWTEQITTRVSSKSSMTLPNFGPLRVIPPY